MIAPGSAGSSPADPGSAPAQRAGRPRSQEGAPSEPPPLLGSWRALYALVLAELAALVLGFYALTWWAS